MIMVASFTFSLFVTDAHTDAGRVTANQLVACMSRRVLF